VPDGSLATSETRALRSKPVSAPVGTQHVPEGTQHVPDLPRFGRYRAEAELGAGGMGKVYRGHDDVLGRAVAIKTLHAGEDSGIRERFVREARAIGAVHHPNILAVFDVGTEGEAPYLVIELAPGGSLRDRLKIGTMPVDTVRLIGIQMARALAAAHAVNILHRDVKPANILCTQDGVWKLADFGIARLPNSTLTITGQFLGSPSYAAPESLRAGEFSPTADVYGLGATLYEALTGAPPYGDHDMQSLVRKLEQDPPPLREQIAVPPALGDVIMAALSRDPARRPSAEQLAQRLASADMSEARALPAAGFPAAGLPVAGLPAAAPSVAVMAAAGLAVAAVPARATSSRTRTLVIAGLTAVAFIALIVLATRDRSLPSAQAVPSGAPATSTGAMPPGTPDTTESRTASPGETADPNAQSTDPEQDPDMTQPTVVDQYGNPVDPETARRVLEQREPDLRGEPPPRGRGYFKHKGRGH
jgi:hypothetical protein